MIPRHALSSSVKFVRLDAPLADILGERPDENSRQTAAEKFRDLISRCKKDTAKDQFRIVVVPQKKLWEDGLRAGKLFALQKQRDLAEGVRPSGGGDEDQENGGHGAYDENGNGFLHDDGGLGYGPNYGGGKWGKYLRAPNLYFQIMERYASRFVPLGEIATIRFGVKSGCDAFFMPRDVSQEFLDKYPKLEWINAPLHAHCKRAEVESGEVILARAGDGTVHPIEKDYLRAGSPQFDECQPAGNFSRRSGPSCVIRVSAARQAQGNLCPQILALRRAQRLRINQEQSRASAAAVNVRRTESVV